MAERFLKLFGIVILLFQTRSHSSLYRSTSFGVLKHSVLNATSWKELKVYDIFECLWSCLREDQCLSINFEVTERKEERPVCQLLKVMSGPSGSLSTRKSSRFHYYFKKCSGGWLFYKESCFFFSNVAVNWYTAEERCIELGASLVKINDQPEYNFLQTNNQEGVWIGLNDIVTEKDFRWQDQSSLSSGYVVWDRNQPNDWNGQDCVYVNTGGKMHDMSCQTINIRYVCEKLL